MGVFSYITIRVQSIVLMQIIQSVKLTILTEYLARYILKSQLNITSKVCGRQKQILLSFKTK